MAKINDLVKQVGDPRLRRELETAVAELKKRTRFGLVYESHLPEMTALPGFPIAEGAFAVRRDRLSARHAFRVCALDGGVATVEPLAGGQVESVPVTELMALQRFGEPIYPGLERVGSTERGRAERPHHAVINAENYHAAQLLLHLYEGQVDCLYLDPPYNTGARDWTYNNDYVDSNDSFRHSKWLSFMEKRLRLAKRLLKSDGVLIITIDEHEVHHLGVLLEEIFPQYLRYMISIIINPKGTYKQNFGRVDEQAFFVVPDLGKHSVIKEVPKNLSSKAAKNILTKIAEAMETENEEDEYVDGEDEEDDAEPVPEAVYDATTQEYEYQHARRRGTESSYRHQRPKQFYPIYIDEKARKVMRIGDFIEPDAKPDLNYTAEGFRPIWPIDLENLDRCWRFSPESMRRELELGNLFLGKLNKERNSWTLNIRRPKKSSVKLKTVWIEKEYDAGTHGTGLVRKLLGKPGLFAFPKSLYAVKDCLAAVTRNRPNALIVDFFAGSGTTFHATCLLNAEDGGRRRCILVTNNDVKEEQAKALHKEGYCKGDPEFEAHGIFEAVTRPRCQAVVTGHRADGTAVPGAYIGGRPLADGFEENVTFFKLNYLNPDQVDMGQQFAAIAPLLWLESGGFGSWEPERAGASRSEPEPERAGYFLPTDARFGVLFRASRIAPFLKALEARPDITHVSLVTSSEDAYAQMRAALPPHIHTRRLYRDYLRSFRLTEPSTAEGAA